jgi:hypothetical protein
LPCVRISTALLTFEVRRPLKLLVTSASAGGCFRSINCRSSDWRLRPTSMLAERCAFTFRCVEVGHHAWWVSTGLPTIWCSFWNYRHYRNSREAKSEVKCFRESVADMAPICFADMKTLGGKIWGVTLAKGNGNSIMENPSVRDRPIKLSRTSKSVFNLNRLFGSRNLRNTRNKRNVKYYWRNQTVTFLMRSNQQVRIQICKLYYIHSFSILSDERSKVSSKTIPPHSAI